MDRHLLSSQTATKSCRICLEDDNPTDLISPCLCSGGSAYVHRKCLDNWRSLNKDGRAFKSCDVCRFEYVLEPVVDDPSADKRRLLIFRLLVTRDIVLIILLLQAIIIGMTFVLQAADKKHHKIKDLYPTSMSSFGIYYLSSLILFFALLGLFGLIALCYVFARNGNDGSRECPCYSCFCFGSNCNENDKCGGKNAGILVIVIVLMFAVLGVFFGIILSGIIIRDIIKRHTNKVWLKQETKKYIVKDLQGKANELMNRSTQRRSKKTSSKNTRIDYNSTLKTPSAPIQLVTLTAPDT